MLAIVPTITRCTYVEASFHAKEMVQPQGWEFLIGDLFGVIAHGRTHGGARKSPSPILMLIHL